MQACIVRIHVHVPQDIQNCDQRFMAGKLPMWRKTQYVNKLIALWNCLNKSLFTYELCDFTIF